MTGMNMNVGTAGPARRAFSLVEMLTVIVILVLVLSILLPVLGRVRNSAKDTQTRQIMKDVGNASQQFEIDQKRPPGYFGAVDMGSQKNKDTYGFSSMQNLLLDLSGGVTDVTSESLGNSQPCNAPSAGGPSVIQVGPTDKQQVMVDIPTIGNPSQTRKGAVVRAYFKPDPKYFAAQCGSGQWATTTLTDQAMPTVVDAFGMPILAWVQDDLTNSDTPFAAESSQVKRAKFYWSQNAGALHAIKLGKTQVDQKNLSLLGDGEAGNAPDTAGEIMPYHVASLLGVLGNPGGGSKPATGAGPFAPTLARGPIVLQSAGIDGVFLGRTERGGKVAGNYLQFKPNQDVMGTGAFDDAVTAFGN
jgi:prepilin-type N-terminal cleavage/methylation domain-containing protein